MDNKTNIIVHLFQFIPEHDADDLRAEFEIESGAYVGLYFF